MLRHAGSDDFAVQGVERGEQSGGAVTLVIMSNSTSSAFLQGQSWLRSISRLDLALFIN